MSKKKQTDNSTELETTAKFFTKLAVFFPIAKTKSKLVKFLLLIQIKNSPLQTQCVLYEQEPIQWKFEYNNKIIIQKVRSFIDNHISIDISDAKDIIESIKRKYVMEGANLISPNGFSKMPAFLQRKCNNKIPYFAQAVNTFEDTSKYGQNEADLQNDYKTTVLNKLYTKIHLVLTLKLNHVIPKFSTKNYLQFRNITTFINWIYIVNQYSLGILQL